MSESLLTLWINSETNTLLPNWNSGGTMTLPPFKQGDNVKLEIHWVRSDTANQFMEEVVIPTAAQIKVAIGVVNGVPSGGFFVYSFEGDTVEIQYDSTAQEVETLLNSLPSITAAGGVTVSLVNQRTYRVVFNNVGARNLPTCDSTGLTPSTTVFVARINAGSSTSKEVHHLRPKLNPVAYSDSFVDTAEPEIAITVIDAITNRISISPAPKYGTFTITNGTLTTTALSIYSSANTVQDALVSSGISNSTRSYSVAKSGEFVWDIYRTKGTSETLSVSDSGLVGFSSKNGDIDLNTIEVEDLLAGAAEVNAVLEVEYSLGSVKQTIYQGNIRIVNDLIDNATYNPIPFPLPLEDAPSDGSLYARKDGAWVAFIEEDNQGITQSYADTHYYPLNSNPAGYLDADDIIDGGTY